MVPVRISAEASAHVERIGLRPVMEQMIDYLNKTAPGLRSIDVQHSYFPDAPWDGEKIVLTGYHDERAGEPSTVSLHDRFDRWIIETFAPEVRTNFITFLAPGELDGR